MSEDPWTTIRIRKSTRRKLRLYGKQGESYDGIILRLIEVRY